MEGILTFNTDDEDDKVEFDMAVHAREAFTKLLDIDNTCRNWLKYENKLANEVHLEEIREMIREDKLLDYVQ